MLHLEQCQRLLLRVQRPGQHAAQPLFSYGGSALPMQLVGVSSMAVLAQGALPEPVVAAAAGPLDDSGPPRRGFHSLDAFCGGSSSGAGASSSANSSSSPQLSCFAPVVSSFRSSSSGGGSPPAGGLSMSAPHRSTGPRQRVAVGISGGVDSAVAAMLLKQQGHEVVGVFMRNWDEGEETGNQNCSVERDLRDAAAVCRQLGIPLHEADFVSKYWTQVGKVGTGFTDRVWQRAVSSLGRRAWVTSSGQQRSSRWGWRKGKSSLAAEGALAACGGPGMGAAAKGVQVCTAVDTTHAVAALADGHPARPAVAQVFSEFVSQCARGLTPNPDLACNRHIKFDALLSFAEQLGADAVATGHYARVAWPTAAGRGASATAGSLAGSSSAAGPQLLRGLDRRKDQTYFLASVQQQALERVLFPVGGLLKPQVRQFAAEAGLVSATRRSSAGICFIGVFLLPVWPLAAGAAAGSSSSSKCCCCCCIAAAVFFPLPTLLLLPFLQLLLDGSSHMDSAFVSTTDQARQVPLC